MSNALAMLRAAINPAVRRRTGTVTAYADGWATVTWAEGGSGQVLCGLSVSRGDRVLVLGDAVSAKLPAMATRTVKIL